MPVIRTSSRSISFTPSRVTYGIILNIRRKVKSVLGNVMFLHTTSITIEEHVVHLFLILNL